MVLFFTTTILIFIFNEFLVNFWYIFDEFFFIDNFFIKMFFIIFVLNFFFIKNKANFNWNYDIFYKFYNLIFRKPNYLLNYIINNCRMIFTFLVYFRYRLQSKMISILYYKYSKNYSIVWRPLFKKFSYFGYYRSNRSKWIK